MAPTPTTSALGALGDVARPAPARSSARTDDSADKPSFSNALDDARNDRPEPVKEPAKREPEPARAERSEAEPPAPISREPAAPARKTAATAPPTGKDLPPAGDDLPAADAALPSLDDLLTTMLGQGDDSTPATDTSTSDDEAAASPDAVAAAVATAVVAPVLPENAAAAAAAALAARSAGQQPVSDDGPGGLSGVTDATQKRAVPTAAQALNDVASLSDETVAASAAVAVAATEPVSEPVAADADVATDTAPQPEGLDGLKLAAHTPRNAQAADAQAGDSGSFDNSAAIAPNARAQTAEPVADDDRASFRDTLKQIDTTLSARSGDAPAVTTPRDNGLRQYIDGSANAAKVDIPVGKAGWSDAVAGKVMWMSAQNLSSAEIQMNPPDLGPLSVRVSSQQDQTSVYFSSPHAPVREALDQSLPRLRDMLGNQGIQLLDVGVGGQGSMREQRAFSQQGNGGGGGNSGRGGPGDMEPSVEVSSVARSAVVRARPGLLDAYA